MMGPRQGEGTDTARHTDNGPEAEKSNGNTDRGDTTYGNSTGTYSTTDPWEGGLEDCEPSIHKTHQARPTGVISSQI